MRYQQIAGQAGEAADTRAERPPRERQQKAQAKLADLQATAPIKINTERQKLSEIKAK